MRYLHEILATHGHEVRVAITGSFNKADTWFKGADDIITKVPNDTRSYQRLFSLANRWRVPQEFSRLVDRFQPDVIHFASFDQSKSANLYWHCKHRGIRLVLQPWSMHFFCEQGYGFREGQQCTLCISEGFGAAIRKSCCGLDGSLRQLERVALRRMATSSADVVLSSNSDLDTILTQYGVPAQAIRRFPIPFNVLQVPLPPDLPTEDYFINFGQADASKGTDVLMDLFASMPDKQLRFYPIGDYSPRRFLPSNIQVIRGLGWTSGLSEAIAKAKAVVQPSLWATSTEYALCEAMAMGKPIIAFRVGVHKEILVHEKNAMVIEPGDFKQFKAAVDALDVDTKLRSTLSANAIACIKEINAPEKLSRQLIDLYSR